MKRLLLFILLMIIALLLVPPAKAQTPLIKYGDKQFYLFNFREAVEIYQSALRKDTGNIYLQTKIADCYRLMGDLANSEKYYAKLAGNNALDPMNKYYYAQALRSNQKYGQAADAFQSYLDQTKKADPAIQECIDGARQSAKMSRDNGRYLLENMHEVNSSGSDFAPAFFTDKSIWFTSNRDQHKAIVQMDNWSGMGYLRGYITASLATRVYSKPVIAKSKGFNKKFHEGPAFFDKTKSELYITRSNIDRKKQKTIKTKLYKVTCDASGAFVSPLTEAVSFNSNDYSVMHPCISPDEKMLFFASDMPAQGARGGMDLYVSMRDATGGWGTPQNLGTDFNTMGDEMFPYFAGDSALYFASDGHAGLGGLDIYRSFLLPGGQWSRPKNLGAPVNTNADDFSYIIDEKGINGMFASNRSGGSGGDDLYSFIRNEINAVGQVVDVVTLLPVEDVKVTLAEDHTTESTMDKTDRNGGFCFTVKPRTQYTLSTSKLGYAPRTEEVVTRDGTSRRTIYISRLGAVHMLVTINDAITTRHIKGATGIITDMQTKENAEFLTDATGVIYADIVLGHQYKIDVDKKPSGTNKYFLSETKTVSSENLQNGDTLKVDIELTQNTINYTASLKNVYFDLDKWNIRPDASIELDKVTAALKDNPTWRIQVAAHTDCRETEEYNLALSQKRAASVVSYLTKHGISASRMTPIGYGKTMPAVECRCSFTGASDCDEDQHQLNRRVEFVILGANSGASARQ